jgi:8-oxo-dGTP pyrophosphatase MutT (NUDIX family)
MQKHGCLYKELTIMENKIIDAQDDSDGFIKVTKLSELWDILDINGDKTGRVIERGQPMYDGEYHLAVHVWIHNRKGDWLISKRSPDKKTSPSMWETCGGAAFAGDDSLTTALREAKEELGLTLAPDKGRLLKTIALENKHPPGGSCIVDVWIFSHDCPIGDVILQPGETCDARWESADAIRAMIASGDFASEAGFDELRQLNTGIM